MVILEVVVVVMVVVGEIYLYMLCNHHIDIVTFTSITTRKRELVA